VKAHAPCDGRPLFPPPSACSVCVACCVPGGCGRRGRRAGPVARAGRGPAIHNAPPVWVQCYQATSPGQAVGPVPPAEGARPLLSQRSCSRAPSARFLSLRSLLSSARTGSTSSPAGRPPGWPGRRRAWGMGRAASKPRALLLVVRKRQGVARANKGVEGSEGSATPAALLQPSRSRRLFPHPASALYTHTHTRACATRSQGPRAPTRVGRNTREKKRDTSPPGTRGEARGLGVSFPFPFLPLPSSRTHTKKK